MVAKPGQHQSARRDDSESACVGQWIMKLRQYPTLDHSMSVTTSGMLQSSNMES